MNSTKCSILFLRSLAFCRYFMIMAYTFFKKYLFLIKPWGKERRINPLNDNSLENPNIENNYVYIGWVWFMDGDF